MNRPTFYTNNNKTIRSAGFLFYSSDKYDNNITYLFRYSKDKWQDIGGKSDVKDKNALDTAIRECCEETNNHLFSKKHDYNQCSKRLRSLVKYINPIYCLQSKYLCFPVYLERNIMNTCVNRLGNKELESNEDHKYIVSKYIPIIIDMNPRLSHVFSKILIRKTISTTNYLRKLLLKLDHGIDKTQAKWMCRNQIINLINYHYKLMGYNDPINDFLIIYP